MKKPKEKIKKIHSLRHQITAYFIGLLFLSILTITVINGAFLEKYYVTKKIDVLLDLRTTLENTDIDKMMNSNSSKGSESIPDEIQRACSRNNLSWVIIDSSNTSWLSWGENEKMLQSKLFGYVYGLDEDGDKSRTLKQGDNYTIQQSHDRFAGMDYVECWGQLDDEHYFIIRTPLESIRESADISNKFYFAVGLMIIILSGLIIMVVTRRITRPISELTEYTRQLNTNEKTRGKSPYAGTIPITYFQKRFINSRLIILLISGIKHILLLLTSASHSITVGAYGFN